MWCGILLVLGRGGGQGGYLKEPPARESTLIPRYWSEGDKITDPPVAGRTDLMRDGIMPFAHPSGKRQRHYRPEESGRQAAESRI